MCIVCIEYAKGTLTRKEALRAFWEQINTIETESDEKHIQEAYAKIENESEDVSDA